MKKLIYAAIAILLLTTGCKNESHNYTRLKTIDSLFVTGDKTVADSMLKEIDENSIKDNNTKAYFYLMKATADIMLKGIPGDTDVIDFCIKHYEKTGNDTMMARSYYYKGLHQFFKGNNKEALYFLKKAESKDREAETPWLRDFIYANLSYINSVLGAKNTALHYAKKELEYALKINKPTSICFAYNNVAKEYYDMGKKDSALILIFKIEPYLDKVRNIEMRSHFLSNIGYAHYEKGRYHKAEEYIEEAYAMFKGINTTINLAKTYYMLGKDTDADALSAIVLDKGNAEEKAEMLLFLAERAEDVGKFKEAASLFHKARVMQDSVNRMKQPEETITAQRDYEHDKFAEDMTNRAETAGAIAVVAVAALAVGGIIWYRRKMNRVGKIIADNNKKIEMYGKQIETLEKSDTRRSNEITALERKIRKLKDEQNAIISSGKRLYDSICQGGDTAKWNKKDFEEFIEYYRIDHPKAVEEAETQYNNLTSANISYLIISDMGCNDSEAQRILCMNRGAFRTMKSRIKSKRIS